MFFKKKDEIIVRGVKQEILDMAEEQNAKREALNHAMKVILDEYTEIEKDKKVMWDQIYEEYGISRKENYRMDLKEGTITLIEK